MSDDNIRDKNSTTDVDASADSCGAVPGVETNWEEYPAVRNEQLSQAVNGSKGIPVGENNVAVKSGDGSHITIPPILPAACDGVKEPTAAHVSSGESATEALALKTADKAKKGIEATATLPKAIPCAESHPAEAAGIPRASVNDVKLGKDAKTKIEELPDGVTIIRTVTGGNQHGGVSTIKTVEKKVLERDAQGKVILNDDGKPKVKMNADNVPVTRVLSEEKETTDKNGKVKFYSNTEHTYTDSGKLATSHTDMFTDGKDAKHKIGELDTVNTYNKKDQLTRHESRVDNAKGEKIQSTDNEYKYDADGNRSEEMIARQAGGKISYEKRDHKFKKFDVNGESVAKVVETDSKLYGADSQVTGFINSKFTRRSDGSLKVEESTRTEIDKNKNIQIAAKFHADYDVQETKIKSTDEQFERREDGTLKSSVISEFRADSLKPEKVDKKDVATQGSVVRKIDYDATGQKAQSEQVLLVQKWDGSIVNRNGTNIVDAEHGLKLGNGNRLDAWKQLEKLSDNRSVNTGLYNLGRFKGGNHEAAIDTLASWGKGDARVGVQALEKWGDGRAADGVKNYLDLGKDSHEKQTQKHGRELAANAGDFLLRLVNGSEGSAKALTETTKSLANILGTSNSLSAHAERVQKSIAEDPLQAAEYTATAGRGTCENGVCTFHELGAKGEGQKGNVENGINVFKQWGDKSSGDVMQDAICNLQLATGGDLDKTAALFDAGGKKDVLDADGKPVIGEDGKVLVESDRQQGSANLLGLALQADGSMKPLVAVETLLDAGETPDGQRDAFLGAENLYQSGIKPVMAQVIGADGQPVFDAKGDAVMQPVLGPDGKALHTHDVSDGVKGLTAFGLGVPSIGMDGVRLLSTTKDAQGNTVIDTRVGFEQFASVGESLRVIQGADGTKTVAAVRDISSSVAVLHKLGTPATDAAGNPVPYMDAQGKPILDAQGKPISQAVAGSMAALELTRDKTGVDGANIYSTTQKLTVNERAIFEKSVAAGTATTNTYRPAENVAEVVGFIGRQPARDGQPAELTGSPLRGTMLLTADQKAADGRTFTLSPDRSAAGALTTIREADGARADQKTMMVGATEIAKMSATTDGTFISGATVTASLADRNTNGQPTSPEAIFAQSIRNVTSFSPMVETAPGAPKTQTFGGGRDTLAYIGGGTTDANSNAVPLGAAQVRTAADRTTNGSVNQMAQVTQEAGRDPVTRELNPIAGAQSIMSYKGSDGVAVRTFVDGATALQRDLNGPNSTAPINPVHVATAVALASPTRPEGTTSLQSGMDKTNALVAASQQAGYKTTTGADVLTNLNSNPVVKAAVQQATDAPAAVAAVVARPGTLAQIANPVVSQTATVAKESTVAVAAVKDATKLTPVVATTLDAPVRAAQPTAALSVANTIERAATPFAMVPRDAVVTASANETKNIAAANNTTVPAATTNSDAARTLLAHSAATKPEAAAAWNPLARPSDKPTQAPLTPAEVHAARVQTEQVARTQAETAKVNAAAAAADTNKFAFTVKPEVATTRPADLIKAGETKTAVPTSVKAASESVVNNARSVVNAVEAQRSVAAAASLAQGSARNVLTNLNEAANAKTAHGNVNVTINNANARAGAAASEATKAGNAVISAARKADAAAAADGARAAIQRTQAGSIASIASTTGGKNHGFLEVRQTLFGGTTAVAGKTAKVFTSNKPISGKKLALTGAEIALAVMFISAAAAKQRDKELKNAKTTNLRIGTVEYAKMSDRLDELEELKQTDATKSFDDDILIRPTWLVRQGEDLVKLAEHLFHEGELGWLIADINAGVIKETLMDGKRVVELKIRQKIELPVWQDIVRFHKMMPEDARPENLITIVNETAVDTELMHNALAGAMGVAPIAKPVFAMARNAQPVMTGAGLMQAQKEAAIAASAAATMTEAKPVLAAARLAVQKTAQAIMKKNDSDQGPTAGATVDDSNPVLKPRLV